MQTTSHWTFSTSVLKWPSAYPIKVLVYWFIPLKSLSTHWLLFLRTQFQIKVSQQRSFNALCCLGSYWHVDTHYCSFYWGQLPNVFPPNKGHVQKQTLVPALRIRTSSCYAVAVIWRLQKRDTWRKVCPSWFVTLSKQKKTYRILQKRQQFVRIRMESHL